MRKEVRRIAKLTTEEWLILGRMILLSTTIGAGARWLGLLRLLSILAPSGRHIRRPRYQHYDKRRLTTLAGIAARFSPGLGRCLARSLIIFWLLRRRGEEGTLIIGVKKVEGVLRGHAWIESDGYNVADTPDVTGEFVPVWCFSLPGAARESR